jgi:hypothetical protein
MVLAARRAAPAWLTGLRWAQGESRSPVLLDYTTANIIGLQSDLPELGLFNASCRK